MKRQELKELLENQFARLNSAQGVSIPFDVALQFEQALATNLLAQTILLNSTTGNIIQ